LVANKKNKVMENQGKDQQQAEKDRFKDGDIGGAQTNQPDPATQNDTGYAGTTNSLSENNEHDGYGIAIEDTMIGYNGDTDQMDMVLSDEDRLRSGSSGADDNG
jgi:hypothetical protein